MKNSPAPLRHHRQGFTLVEVLVSSALTLVVLLMLFSVLLGSMSAWEGGTARLQTNADARLALDLIARDLQSMVVRQTPHNQHWLSSRPIPVPDAPSGVTSTWLTFFSPSLDRDPGQEGDIVALSYVAGFQDPFTATVFTPPTPKIYGLYKTMITTKQTFEEVLGKPDIISGFWSSQLPETNTHPLKRRGFIIPNVVDFKVAWWVRLADNTLSRIEASQMLNLNNQLWVDGTQLNAKIEAADISLTLLTEEGMREAQVGTADQARLQEIIRKHGRSHSQRVVIRY